MSFVAAIVGRPNVGKSTLFNRLTGKKLALVDDTPGVTRDRRIHPARLVDLRFDVIDTAGFEEAHRKTLEGRMRQQTELAIEEADIILFVVDAKAGVTPADQNFAAIARRANKPVVLIANKAEARGSEAGLYESHGLGLGEPVPFSAEHGQGILDLHLAIENALGEEKARGLGMAIEDVAEADVDVEFDEEDDGEAITQDVDISKPLRIAIVGRPNAGKSTLINTVLGQERLLTGPEAGITRDSISVDMEWGDRKVRLFDTAGMRRRSKVQEKLEKLSVADGLRAIRFAEVVVIVLDVTIPFEKQDLQIADLIVREGRAPVIAYNKFDLVENRQEKLKELREMTDRLLPQIRGVRAVPISGEHGEGLDALHKAIMDTYRHWNTRIGTGPLNRWLSGVLANHPPPAVAGRRLKIKYITQAKTRPPGFVLSCTRPDALPASYQRYLVNNLRQKFDLDGIPIRLMIRAGDNPFAGRAGIKGKAKPRR